MDRKLPTNKRNEFGYRALLAVAVPLAATVGCFAITLFTDRTLLMWYGPTSSAASVSAGNLYWAVACIPVTTMGFITPLVALAMGDRRNRGATFGRVWSLLWQCVWLTIASVPLFALIGWFSPQLFEAFGHEPDLATNESQYFRTLLLVAPASMLEAGLTAFFVGRRVTTPILRSNIASAILNVGLDFWLIFGGLGIPALGVFGAALATALSMWFKVAVFAFLLVRLKSFGRHRLAVWRPNRKLIAEIVVPGSALGLQQLVRSSLFSFVLLIIGSASVTGLAATSAALSLYQLLSIPAIGLATAVTVVVGQGFASGGTNLAKKVMRQASVIGVVVAIAIAAVMLAFPGPLLQILLGGLDPIERSEIEPLAIILLRYAAVYCLVDVASLLLGAAAKGIGQTFILLTATAIPGVIAVGWGWWYSPSDELAVTHWWSVLIVWATLQATTIVFGIRREMSQA
ncbi:MATE family efflux transporter [Neorhodopirellula lusitana]|uniref:MATE family efflux transporter n=1 Tax=Neorhodopirellula lusitana TaxID=445327 RepID=UPI0024B75C09|nr:MATE family efflux transporter [Neorhodopirellula lusitana]